MKGKLFAVVFSFLLCSFAFVGVAFGADGTRSLAISPSSVTAHNGQTLNFSVNLSNDDTIVGLQFNISSSDTSLVSIQSVERGADLPDSFSFNAAQQVDGSWKVIIAPPIQNPLPPIPSGEIAKFTVNVSGDQGSVNLTITEVVASDSSGSSVELESVTGAVVNIEPLVPDIDVSPTQIDFGRVARGGATQRSFTISNTGNDDLTVSDVSSDDPAFSVVSPTFPQTVAPGNSLQVFVRFSCSDVGNHTGTLTVSSNDPDEPTVSVSVAGECVNATPPAARPPVNAPTLSEWGLLILAGLVMLFGLKFVRASSGSAE